MPTGIVVDKLREQLARFKIFLVYLILYKQD